MISTLGLLTGCEGTSSPGVATAQTGQPEGSQSSTPATGKDSVLEAFVAARQRWVDCAREQGMSDVKDPDQYGRVEFGTAGVPESILTKARMVCATLQVPVPPEVRKIWDDQYAATITPAEKKMNQEYADCMQANGAPDFPDPLPNGMSPNQGPDTLWDQTSAGAQRALATCLPIVRGPDAAP
ncbi:hypothetical protein GCM10027062_11290 [Nocardioides hungaricus]